MLFKYIHLLPNHPMFPTEMTPISKLHSSDYEEGNLMVSHGLCLDFLPVLYIKKRERMETVFQILYLMFLCANAIQNG